MAGETWQANLPGQKNEDADQGAGMTRQLRDDQLEAITAVRQTVQQKVTRIMLQAPTGWGKTILAADVVRHNVERGKRTTFVIDGLNLLDQTVERFFEEGITDVGVIQRDHPMTNPNRLVQVASVQTLTVRKEFPHSDLVIIDEAHVLYEHHKKWMTEHRNGTLFVGLSATPYTRGLKQYFDTLITPATTEDMIAKGVLCPPRVFSASHPDLKRRLRKVKVVAGEFVAAHLSKEMQDHELTGDVVRSWLELWGKDKTLCFGVDRIHAQALQARFNAAGVRCAYQDAETTQGERATIKRQFHAGEIQVVCSIGTMTKGLDWDVRCISLARPTKSETLFKQIIGRGLRTAPGKEFCLVLDHGRCTQELGFVTEIEAVELDDGKGEKKKRAINYAKECPKCHQFRSPGKSKCDTCGFEPTPRTHTQWIETDDQLDEVDRKTLPQGKKRRATYQEKLIMFGELKHYAKSKGYKSTWAAAKFKDKFGEWPPWGWSEDVPPCAPSVQTLQWIRASNIRWAHSKRNPHNSASKAKPVDPSEYAGVPVTKCPPGVAAGIKTGAIEDLEKVMP